jgi:Flp pilus assembly protein TadG
VSVELAIATPLLLLILLGIVQLALWSHATHVAQAAAAQGLAATRVQGGTAGAGTDRARQFLQYLDGGSLTDTAVHTTRSAERATVDIDGVASCVVPFLELRVHAEAVGAVERVDGPATAGRP